MGADHHRPGAEREGRAAVAQDLKTVGTGRGAASGRARREPGLDHRPPIEGHMQSLTRAARRRVQRDMNDSIRVMRWCGWLLVAACTHDPTLSITVHHPSGYAVTQTTVTAYAGMD